MRRTFLFSLLIAAACPSALLWAEAPPFSSTYTFLAKDCRWAFNEADLREGQDNARICRGPAPYELFIDFSAEAAFLSARRSDRPNETVFGDPVGGVDDENGAVEWRLAEGRPFALIVRTKRRTPLDDGREWKSERLAVRGLGDYSEIAGDVDVRKTPNANAAARTLAERGWRVHRADQP